MQAYCPWCGEPVERLSIYASTGDIEWRFCKTNSCLGARITVVTDKQGFIIHPRRIRGKYIYKKIEKGTKK